MLHTHTHTLTLLLLAMSQGRKAEANQQRDAFFMVLLLVQQSFSNKDLLLEKINEEPCCQFCQRRVTSNIFQHLSHSTTHYPSSDPLATQTMCLETFRTSTFPNAPLSIPLSLPVYLKAACVWSQQLCNIWHNQPLCKRGAIPPITEGSCLCRSHPGEREAAASASKAILGSYIKQYEVIATQLGALFGLHSGTSSHLFAAHPAAGHLEIVLAQATGTQHITGAVLEQSTHRFL